LKSTKQKTKTAADKSLARSQRRKQERSAAKQKSLARNGARIAEHFYPERGRRTLLPLWPWRSQAPSLYIGILRVDFLGLDDPQYVINGPH
jgi:hypothetical protein